MAVSFGHSGLCTRLHSVDPNHNNGDGDGDSVPLLIHVESLKSAKKKINSMIVKKLQETEDSGSAGDVSEA